MNNITMQELDMREKIANIDRQLIETKYTEKRTRWFEFTIGIAIFAAGIAFAKLFV